MTIKIDDPRLFWVQIEAAEQPDDGYICYRDKWWIVSERGVAFWSPSGKKTYKSPQCNESEAVTVLVRNKLYTWADVQKIPRVFVPNY